MIKLKQVYLHVVLHFVLELGLGHIYHIAKYICVHVKNMQIIHV